MKTIRLTNIGRFGNRLFRYAHARALAEQNGYALKTEPWVGEKIFTLDSPPNIIYYRPDGTEDIVIDGYCQNQESLIYSRADCRRWFKLRPELIPKLEKFRVNGPVAHIRRGDYPGAGYPVVTECSVHLAFRIFPVMLFVSEENAIKSGDFTGDVSFLPDFYRLMTAPFLIRSNSSFSFWAGVLSHGKVFSPVITGLAGGVEHDNVPFIPGNSARLAELPNITELHLRET